MKTPPRIPVVPSALSIAALGLIMVIGAPSHAAVVSGGDTETGPPAAGTAAAPSDSAALTAGGTLIFRVRGTLNGMSPQDRVNLMQDRLASILGDSAIEPSNVVVYDPKGQPMIFILGRRFVSVDDATAKQEGEPARTVAIRWAKALQQVLPRINYRPGATSVASVPSNPPITVTDKLAEVGGGVGTVSLQGQVVMRLHGVQPGQMTAAERADVVQRRLNRALNTGDQATAPDVEVLIQPAAANSDVAPADLMVNGVDVLHINAELAAASGYASPTDLGQAWTKTIQTVEYGIPFKYTAMAPDQQQLPNTANTANTEPVLDAHRHKPQAKASHPGTAPASANPPLPLTPPTLAMPENQQ